MTTEQIYLDGFQNQNQSPIPDEIVSEIELTSRISPKKLQTYAIKQFSPPQKNSALALTSVSTATNSTGPNHKVSQLKKQITQIQNSQNLMERKFEACIESLMKEISKKEQQNKTLMQNVSALKEQIEDSKKDIQIILSCVKKTARKHEKYDRKHPKVAFQGEKPSENMAATRHLKRSSQRLEAKLLGSCRSLRVMKAK